jgi:hypothetical protein
MRRPHVDPALGSRINPAASDAPTREHQCVLAILADDRKFKVEIEWGG